jgi:SAM-dependent methyltransferase
LRHRRPDGNPRTKQPRGAHNLGRYLIRLRETSRRAVRAAGITNVTFRQGDLFRLPFPEESFDHIFVCFVLEHLADPILALRSLYPLLRPGGSITVIEGNHGSTLFYPESGKANKAIRCLVDLQRWIGGNALIGRQLYPLVAGAGFGSVKVSPRMVYVDASCSGLVEGFNRQTFTAMVEGVREDALREGLMTRKEWDEAIRDLYRTCEPDGVSCYTFFKATWKK